jgi:hypothetical protein
MDIRRVLLTAMLVLGLLLPVGAAAAERIQRYTDQQGAIRIDNTGPAKREKAGETDGEVKAPAEPVTPTQASLEAQAPPGLLPPHSRRSRGGPEEEARRKAFEEAHPNLIPEPASPPTQLEQQPPPKSQ